MNKQERDELREFILSNYPFAETNTMPNFTGEIVLKLLDQLGAYEKVVEAAKDVIEGYEWYIEDTYDRESPFDQVDDLKKSIKALEGLEDDR